MLVSTSTGRVLSSPSPTRFSDSALPFNKSPSISDFQIERVPKQYPAVSRRGRTEVPAYDDEYVFRENVSRLLAAKARAFTISGRIPLDPATLVMFFRSKVCF